MTGRDRVNAFEAADGDDPPAAWRPAIEAWRRDGAPLRPGFAASVLAALEAEAQGRGERPDRRMAGFAAAAAAVFLLVALPWAAWRSLRVAPAAAEEVAAAAAASAALPAGEPAASRLLVLEAVAAVEAAEAEHERAVARLEAAARPILDAAGDPRLDPRQAVRLVALRNRLRNLDATLAEADRLVAENPYHPKVRALRLAALRSKSDLLRDVVALPLPTGGA